MSTLVAIQNIINSYYNKNIDTTNNDIIGLLSQNNLNIIDSPKTVEIYHPTCVFSLTNIETEY